MLQDKTEAHKITSLRLTLMRLRSMRRCYTGRTFYKSSQEPQAVIWWKLISIQIKLDLRLENPKKTNGIFFHKACNDSQRCLVEIFACHSPSENFSFLCFQALALLQKDSEIHSKNSFLLDLWTAAVEAYLRNFLMYIFRCYRYLKAAYLRCNWCTASESHALDEQVESHGEKHLYKEFCITIMELTWKGSGLWLEFIAMYFLKTGANVTKANAQRDTAFS